MPHLAHKRVSVASRPPSPLPSPVTPRPGSHQQQPSEHPIDRRAWPPFPPVQSLSDDTTQLHLALRSPSPSYSPSPTPSLLSRHPSSSSGQATPDSDNPVSTTVMESFDPGNGSLAPPPESYLTDKTRIKNKRISASSLASLLSANHDDKKERKERKRTEKFTKHQQAMQELRTAERRRAYFRDASHRQELVFGPEVRAFFPRTITLPPPQSNQTFSSVDCC